MKNRLEAIPWHDAEPLRQHVMHSYVHQRHQENHRPGKTPFQPCRLPAKGIHQAVSCIISHARFRSSSATAAISPAMPCPGICQGSTVPCLFHRCRNLPGI